MKCTPIEVVELSRGSKLVLVTLYRIVHNVSFECSSDVPITRFSELWPRATIRKMDFR